MQTKTRIFVKTSAPATVDGKTVPAGHVVHSVDVNPRDVYQNLRELETAYPNHTFGTAQLDPLGI